MEPFKKGDRVRVGSGAKGRVVAVLNGAVYRVKFDKPDPLGRTSCDYLAEALTPCR